MGSVRLVSTILAEKIKKAKHGMPQRLREWQPPDYVQFRCASLYSACMIGG
jgi:hypothetical protein